MPSDEAKHVFVSYVREDAEKVDQLCEALAAAGIPYWRDRTSLAPGDQWKQKIREAIRSGAVVFIACFSEQSLAKSKSYMNEELTLAAEEFRMLPPEATWFIPVRFDDVDVPEWELGAGRMLSDFNYADLFGDRYVANLIALTSVISRFLGVSHSVIPSPSAAGAGRTVVRRPLLDQIADRVRDSSRKPGASDAASELLKPLTEAQQKLLEIVATPMLPTGRWPNINYVQVQMDRLGFDAHEVMRSMPVVGSMTAGKVGYSAVWFDRHNTLPNSTVRLTAAAALHLPDYRPVAEFMIQALKVLVLAVKNHQPSPFEVEEIAVTSEELASSYRHFTGKFVRSFPGLLGDEPFSLYSASTPGEGGNGWRLVGLKPLLRKYDGIDSVEEYVRRVCELIEANNQKVEPAIWATSSSVVFSGGLVKSDSAVSLPVVSSQVVRSRGTMTGIQAHLLTLLIASPGDTKHERDVVEQTIMEVNASRVRSEGRGYLPLRWERDSIAGFSNDGPQGVINPISDQADVVVALFRARMGTATADHESGTVEEVERAIARGVPVHVIFLDYGISSLSEIDADQLVKLREWEKKLRPRGLYEQVRDESHLRSRLRHFLESDLQTLAASGPPSRVIRNRVQWNVDMAKETASSYKLIVTPTGEATDVQVRVVTSSGRRPPTLYTEDRDHVYARRLTANQPLKILAIVAGGTDSIFDLEIKWVEDGEERSEVVTASW